MNDELERLYLQDVDVMIDALRHIVPSLFTDVEDGRRLDKAFRYAHSIKSQAEAVGRPAVAQEAHALEELLSTARTSGVGVIDELQLRDRLFALHAAFAEEQGGAAPTSAGHGDSPVAEKVREEAPDKDAPLLLETAEHREAKLSQELRTMVGEAEQRGERAYLITVALSESSAMPQMRSYLIQTNLERNLAVLTSWNETVDKGSQASSSLFRAVVTTTRSETEIRKLVQVDEVTEIEVDAVGPRSPLSDETDGEGDDTEANVSVSERAHLSATELIPVLSAARRLARDAGIEGRDREHLLELLRNAAGFAGRIRDDLEEDLSDSFGPIARSVRKHVLQMATDRGKSVDVRILGAWTRLPSGLESTIGDVLVQLARNSIDHGIESIALRHSLGKADEGAITLGAERTERWVSIWVEDDGAGIDESIVRHSETASASTDGNTEATEDGSLIDILTTPGFTTVDGDRRSSGRGVGLDIVRHTVETLLSGRLSVESRPGEGTRFTLQFSAAARALDVLVVGVGRRRLAIPQLLINEVRELQAGEAVTSERGERFVAMGGAYTPICGVGHAQVAESGSVGILVNGAAGGVVLIVDRVIAEERVLRYRSNPYLVYSQALDRTVALLVPLHGC